MANTAQSRKRARQAEVRHTRNVGVRTRFRTFLKKVTAAIESGDKAAAETLYKETVSIIDKTASKGLIHQNKAARHKSRLNAQIRAMS